MHLRTAVRLKIRGRLRVMYAEAGGRNAELWYDGPNQITDLGADIIAGILAQDPDSLVSTIEVGDGAFIDPVTQILTGDVHPPIPSETDMRSSVFAAEVVRRTVSGSDTIYTASLKPTEAVGETINEYGLKTKDGRMLAHIIRDETPEKVKGDNAYLFVEWTLTPTIV